ncbi:hypothetical protein CHS0354_036213 [Potamilus streckersoni]|uniref:Uncharacterized protein n=1 Tax=Potamilus streckersoni TaxID=2493646 RepID=A0AAE0W2D2_9BIVA|nr:hypothetical protein CHS0354_036213 [Potamilus streckersoni]
MVAPEMLNDSTAHIADLTVLVKHLAARRLPGYAACFDLERTKLLGELEMLSEEKKILTAEVSTLFRTHRFLFSIRSPSWIVPHLPRLEMALFRYRLFLSLRGIIKKLKLSAEIIEAIVISYQWNSVFTPWARVKSSYFMISCFQPRETPVLHDSYQTVHRPVKPKNGFLSAIRDRDDRMDINENFVFEDVEVYFNGKTNYLLRSLHLRFDRFSSLVRNDATLTNIARLVCKIPLTSGTTMSVDDNHKIEKNRLRHERNIRPMFEENMIISIDDPDVWCAYKKHLLMEKSTS